MANDVTIDFGKNTTNVDFKKEDIVIDSSPASVTANFVSENVDVDFVEENVTVEFVGGSSIPLKYELFTLDADDISSKYVEVVGTITDNQSIMLFIENVGIKAQQGLDYSVSGNQIFWSGYELESLLEVNDKLKIFYI